MALTYAAFIQERPEFARVDETLVEAKLAMAARRVDPCIWGNRTDDGISLLAAHLLWSSPFGATTRLEGDRDPKEKSRYWNEYARMARDLGAHFLLT